nr:hypothetical protein [Chromobacterium sp. ASV5]
MANPKKPADLIEDAAQAATDIKQEAADEPVGLIAQLGAEAMEHAKAGNIQQESVLSGVVARLHALKLAIQDVDHKALDAIKSIL